MRTKPILIVIIVLITAALACGPLTTPTPPPDVSSPTLPSGDTLATQVAATLTAIAAEIATQTAVALTALSPEAPSATPSPTEAPCEVAPVQTLPLSV